MAAHGGCQRSSSCPMARYASPLTLHPERLDALNSHLMLFFTIKRTAATIAQSYVSDVASVEKQLRTMGRWSTKHSRSWRGIRTWRVRELLHESWRAKRSLSKQVSNRVIDEIYATARSAGALGANCLVPAVADSCCCSRVPPITSAYENDSPSLFTSRFGLSVPAAGSSFSIPVRITRRKRVCV